MTTLCLGYKDADFYHSRSRQYTEFKTGSCYWTGLQPNRFGGYYTSLHLKGEGLQGC